jgi:hypothetical protein
VIHMTYTLDRDDPRLGHGSDKEPKPQNEVYLILSEEERAKGFVRPVRHKYIHVGAAGHVYALRDLTDGEKERYSKFGYVKYEEYPTPNPDGSSVIGRYWTQKDIDNIGKGCGVETVMSLPLAETYARDPKFYGATYCVGCMMHKPVAEFKWSDTDEVVGS